MKKVRPKRNSSNASYSDAKMLAVVKAMVFLALVICCFEPFDAAERVPDLVGQESCARIVSGCKLRAHMPIQPGPVVELLNLFLELPDPFLKLPDPIFDADAPIVCLRVLRLEVTAPLLELRGLLLQLYVLLFECLQHQLLLLPLLPTGIHALLDFLEQVLLRAQVSKES